MGGGAAGEDPANLSEIQRVLLMMAQEYQQRADAGSGLSFSAAAVIGGGVMVGDEKLHGGGQRGSYRAQEAASTLFRGAGDGH